MIVDAAVGYVHAHEVVEEFSVGGGFCVASTTKWSGKFNQNI